MMPLGRRRQFQGENLGAAVKDSLLDGADVQRVWSLISSSACQMSSGSNVATLGSTTEVLRM